MSGLLLGLAALWAAPAAIDASAAPAAADSSAAQPIRTAVPARPEGARSLIGHAVAPLDTVRVGFIGLGMRGPGAVERFTQIPGTRIVAVCDKDTARAAKMQRRLHALGVDGAASYAGSDTAWRALCRRPDIDLVYIATDWRNHTPMALYAMDQGKHVAIEVPSATTLEEIWALVDKAETTGLHCMQLENCVYDFFELNTLNMAQQGLFGDLIHAEGSYIHNLDPFWDYYADGWRGEFNATHRGDVYPTHGMGPVCQLLDIHRGDRITTLTAMDTKATHPGFTVGDNTMTMMRTDKGRSILIEHDVVNPRPYSRMYQLTGTEGFASKYPVEGYSFRAGTLSVDSMPDPENLSEHEYLTPGQTEALLAQYGSPLIAEVGDKAKEVGGHGGMDYIMDYRLVYCLRNGLPLDMDVYDLAEWCAVSPLSAISIENGSAPVEFPDFTRGSWDVQKGYRHVHK